MIPGVCQSVMWFRCANVAQQIEVMLGLETLGNPRFMVLKGSLSFPTGI